MKHVTDTDCVDCGEPIPIQTAKGDQLVRCPHCQRFWWATYDADGESEIGVTVRWRGGFSLHREEPCSHPPAMWESCSQCRDAQSGC